MTCRGCSNDDIFLPFKRELEANQSSFMMDVPSHDSNYFLSFADFDVVPGYFSDAANDLDIDPDEKLKSIISYNLSYKVKYVVPKIRSHHILFPVFKWADVPLPNFINQFNKFWDNHKPQQMLWGACFMDWVIVDEEGKAPFLINDYVEERLNQFYTDYQTVNHFGTLPTSANHLQSAINNYDLPSDYMSWDNLRLRIFLGPYMKLTCKQKAILEILGFKDQFVNDIIENKTSRYANVIGAQKPQIGFKTRMNDIFLEPIDFIAPGGTIFLSNEMLKRPDQVAWEINTALRRLATVTNFDLSLSYKRDIQKWKFNWPANSRIHVTVDLNNTVAQALGYNTNIITKDTFSKASKISVVSTDYLDRARTLTLDTGFLVCTQSDTAACNLAGVPERYVAYLKYTDCGTMSLSKRKECMPNFSLNAQNRGTLRDTCTVYFRLYTSNDTGTLVPLQWPCKTYICGMIVGQKCKC